jgi:YD repeat-containing protein
MVKEATVGGVTTRYRYDGDGLRVAKDDGGALRISIHGPAGELLSELRECPTGLEAVRDHIQAGGRLVAIVKPSPPTVALVAAALSGGEQPGASVSLSVRITTASGCPLGAPVTVGLATAAGTAQASADFLATNVILTFAAGTPSGSAQIFQIPLVNDTLPEPNETFQVTLANPMGAVLGTPVSTTVTIVDNDTPTVAWVSAGASVLENGGTVGLSVRVITPEGNALHGPATVAYATGNATAVAPADYTAQTGVLTFAAGLPSGSQAGVSVAVARDTLVEKDETFKVTLSAPAGAKVAPPAVAIVTVVDVSPQVRFSATAFETVEGEGPALASVSLITPDGSPTAAPVTLRYAASNGSALATKDYLPSSGVLTFPAGAASGSSLTFPVGLVGDLLSEDTETIKLTLSAPVGGKLGSTSTAIAVILDDDAWPVVSIGDASITEPNGGAVTLSFKLTLSAPAGRAVNVGYATSDASALAASDYTAKAGIAKFAAGAVSATVTVPVRGDTLDEDNEAFVVTLGDPVSVHLGKAIAQGSILDNDGRPALCQPIARVPYVISAGGAYCLASDLTFEQPDGEAILIEADHVRLDLRGHLLLGNIGSTATRGVYASDRTGLVVRNGRLQGFGHAIELLSGSPHQTSGSHLVEKIEVEAASLGGIRVMGRHSVVRAVVVQDTGGGGGGGSEEGGGGSDVHGIALYGPGVRVLDSDVRNTQGVGSGEGRAIVLDQAPGAVAQGNRLTGDGAGTGLLVQGSPNVLAVGNRLLFLSEGLRFDEGSSGSYRGNFSSGVANPYQGGSDAGGNQ